MKLYRMLDITVPRMFSIFKKLDFTDKFNVNDQKKRYVPL